MANWIWNKEKRAVGEFILGTPIANVPTSIIQLEKFDYEDFHTYRIDNCHHSKLFFIKGLLYSIQCDLHFIAEGIDLIGKTIEEAQQILDDQFHITQQHLRWPHYANDDETVEIIIDKKDPNNSIIHVIVRLPKL